MSLINRLRANISATNVSEGDDALTGRKALRDIVSSKPVLELMKNNIWLIALVTVFILLYVAVGYQCQQDAITINRLEKDVEDAKLRSLSSMSDLTRLSRQSNLEQLLTQNGDTTLNSSTPPFIINVPE